jgi:hypothetical protein
MKNTSHMSRADVIVLLTAHLSSSLIDMHGATDSTPKRCVDFASKLADELVAQGVVEAPDSDEDKGGPFTDFRTSTDDELLDLDEVEDDAPEVTTDTEPAPAPEPELPKVSEAPPAPAQPSDFGTVTTA